MDETDPLTQIHEQYGFEDTRDPWLRNHADGSK